MLSPEAIQKIRNEAFVCAYADLYAATVIMLGLPISQDAHQFVLIAAAHKADEAEQKARENAGEGK